METKVSMPERKCSKCSRKVKAFSISYDTKHGTICNSCFKEIFTATKRPHDDFQIDEEHKLFVCGRRIFGYDDLLTFDLLEDSNSEVRTLDDGMFERSKIHEICTSLRLKVTLKNSFCETVYITFINSPTRKDKYEYTAAYGTAQKCMSLLELIKSKQQAGQQIDMPPSNSIADELIKLKRLLDEGILTRDEFEHIKKQLIGL